MPESYKKIGDFVPVTELLDGDVLLISRTGVTMNVTGSLLKALCLNGSAELRLDPTDNKYYWWIFNKNTRQMEKSIQAQIDAIEPRQISGFTIDENYHLIVHLDDGSTYDAGYCRGPGGYGTGDMQAATYDPNGNVASAGGISLYVSGAISDNNDTFDPDGEVAEAGGIPDYISGRVTYRVYTLSYTLWNAISHSYDLETEYPNAQYDLSVSVDKSATSAQYEAFGKAKIVSSGTDNYLRYLGDVPTVDIPVLLKITAK